MGITIMSSSGVDLDPEVCELGSEHPGEPKPLPNLEAPRLQEHLQCRDEVAFRHSPIVPPDLGFGVPAVYRDGIEAKPAATQEIHHGRPNSGAIDGKGGFTR